MQSLIDYKGIAAALIFLFTAGTNPVFAQMNTIEVTFNKTSSLVFPHPVTAVDRGSRDVLVQKVNGARNILYLKAARPAFSETNLTVITADGSIREFTVVYSAHPAVMITHIGTDNQDMLPIIFNNPTTEDDLARRSAQILKSKKVRKIRHSKSGGVRLALKNISVADDVLFFHLEIRNGSHIGYTTDMLRFFIEDKKLVRRTATQKRNLLPVYASAELDSIPGGALCHAVLAFDKFTIPDAKRLVIEVFEQNGGRHMHLSIPNRILVQAISL